jgi:hypothetical protein
MLTDISVVYLGKERIASRGLRGNLQEKVQGIDGKVTLNWKVYEWLGGYRLVSLAQDMDNLWDLVNTIMKLLVP